MAITYVPLEFPSRELRTIQIHPAAELQSPLVVTMRHHLFEDVEALNLKYTALSYVWGDQTKDRVPVFVRYERPCTLASSIRSLFHLDHESSMEAFATDQFTTQSNGSPQIQTCKTTVGENLGVAMRHIRSMSTPIWLWADAICINQEDDEEKSQQVNIMYTIFASAYSVTAWLGSPNEHSDSAFDTMNSLRVEFEKFSFHDIPELCDWSEDGAADEPKYCGITLSQFPWMDEFFERLWRMENPTDSNKRRLRPFLDQLIRGFYSNVHRPSSGRGYTVSFHDLYQRPYWNRTWVIQECFSARDLTFQCGNRRTPATFFWVFERLLLSYKTFIHDDETEMDYPEGHSPLRYEGHPGNTRNKLLLYSVRHEKKSLSWVLQVAHEFNKQNATDCRDYVYALLGVAADPLGIKVDYSASTVRVYANAASAILESGNFKPLEYFKATNGSSRGDYPSWAVDWSGTVIYPRYISLPGVHCSRQRERGKLRFGAIGNAAWEMGNHKLSIKGEQVTSISLVTNRRGPLNEYEADGFTWKSWTDCFLDRFKILHDQLLSTSHNDQSSMNDLKSIDQLIDIALAFAEITTKDHHIETVRQQLRHVFSQATWPGDLEIQHPEAIAILSKIYNTFFYDTAEAKVGKTEDGRIFYTEADCIPGDCITIFYDGRVPFVLRKLGEQLHKIIGTAYVHGIMNGRFEQQQPTELFIII